MSIIKWNPFMPFEDIEREMLSVMPMSGDNKAFLPAVDIYKNGNNLVIEANMPSVDPDKIEASIENDVLTLKGESNHQSEIDDKNFYRKEVRRGSFFRTIALPNSVAGDKANASYENGILKVTVPLIENKKTKSIKITVKSKK